MTHIMTLKVIEIINKVCREGSVTLNTVTLIFHIISRLIVTAHELVRVLVIHAGHGSFRDPNKQMSNLRSHFY